MTNRIIKSITMISAAVTLAACQTTTQSGPRGYGGQPNTGVATVAGAATGGVIGSQFGKGNGKLVATGIGTLIGAGIGGAIGQNMDAADRRALESDNRYVERAGNLAVQTGTNQKWHNTKTGSWGTIKIVNQYTQEISGQNSLCREFDMISVRNDLPHEGNGTACNINGKWQIINS
jgi:surface antigen